MLAVGAAGEALDLAGRELQPSLDILVVPHATLARPMISDEDHADSRKCARPVAGRTDRIVLRQTGTIRQWQAEVERMK